MIECKWNWKKSHLKLIRLKKSYSMSVRFELRAPVGLDSAAIDSQRDHVTCIVSPLASFFSCSWQSIWFQSQLLSQKVMTIRYFFIFFLSFGIVKTNIVYRKWSNRILAFRVTVGESRLYLTFNIFKYNNNKKCWKQEIRPWSSSII